MSPDPEPNQAASVDAPIARLFAFLHRRRRATDQRRSAAIDGDWRDW